MKDDRYARTLRELHWSPPTQATSSLLTEHGIRHGFVGVNGKAPDDRHKAKQVHGTVVVRADARTAPTAKDPIHADGVWTANPGEKVSVQTADCLPVLLATKDGRAVMAVHAGWRGMVAGIIFEGIKAFEEHLPGLKPDDLIACIGPAIGMDAFEVGPEVIAALSQQSSRLDHDAQLQLYHIGRIDRFHLNLQGAGALQLVNAGIPPRQVEIINACTKTLAGKWHSYRREGKGCGLNWSWIQATSSS